MSNSQPSMRESVSLDDLAALTDEMAALAKAGVPLESGLARTAEDLARRPGKVASVLAERMRNGQSLSQVVADSPDVFPPLYQAVVEAGVRSGRLAVALEGLATSLRRAAELRRLTFAATLYPLFIVFLTLALFVASLIYFQPWVHNTRVMMEVPTNPVNFHLIQWGRTAMIWGPLAAIVTLAVLGLWWYRSGRATHSGVFLTRWLPTARLIRYGRIAAFAETLALLIEHRNPFEQSIVLAADASGDRALSRSARQLAEQLARGGKAPASATAGFPPLLGWLVAEARHMPTTLAAALRDTAEAYRRRAMRLDDWMRMYLPMVLTIVLGGTAVALYTVSMLFPWYETLREIAIPS